MQQGFAPEKHKLFMEKKTFIMNGKKLGYFLGVDGVALRTKHSPDDPFTPWTTTSAWSSR